VLVDREPVGGYPRLPGDEDRPRLRPPTAEQLDLLRDRRGARRRPGFRRALVPGDLLDEYSLPDLLD
jgi:hypothetical protein